MKNIRLKKEFWFITIVTIILATILASIDGSGHWFQAWIAYGAMLVFGALSTYWVWKLVKANRNATTVAIVSFSLRLSAGLALALLLPILGYQNNPEHLSGYIYTDAFFRDNQAWDLVTSGDPLSQAFSGQFSGDQYGGMLGLSALIYRFLSPDAHRPFLILIASATFSAWGILCLWKASRTWFNEKIALLAIWLFALYPESILLGSSQMREAIVIPMTAISFYGLTEIRQKMDWLVMADFSAVFYFQSTLPVMSFSPIWDMAHRSCYIKHDQATSNHLNHLPVALIPPGSHACRGFNHDEPSLNPGQQIIKHFYRLVPE
jgi:hypothetical protein